MNGEQATALTDGILALEALGLAGILWFRRSARSVAAPMAGFFVFVGLGAALGGAWHAWENALTAAAGFYLWKSVLLIVGLANACLLAALARAPCLRDHRRLASSLIVAKLAGYAVVVAITNAYFAATADQLLTLLAGLGIVAWDATHERGLPNGWLAFALTLAVTGGTIQASHVGLSGTLNHNVLYHLVAMAALAAFGLAALRWDRPVAVAP